MDKITLNKPYKITQRRQKQYINHYQIPAETCIVIPLKKYDDQLLCDIQWKDSSKEMHTRKGLMIDVANLEALDAMLDHELFIVWEAYSSVKSL
jgi:hypothetical protein